MTTPSFVIPATAKYWRSADDRSQFYGTLDCDDVPFKVKVVNLDQDPKGSVISDSYTGFKPMSFIEYEVQLSGCNDPFTVQIEYSDDRELVCFWTTEQKFPLNGIMTRRLEALVCVVQDLHRKIIDRLSCSKTMRAMIKSCFSILSGGLKENMKKMVCEFKEQDMTGVLDVYTEHTHTQPSSIVMCGNVSSN